VRATVASAPRAPAFIMGLGSAVSSMGSRSISSFSRTTCSPTRVTTRAPPSPAEDNTLADGLFHLATWFLVVTAMLLIVRAWQHRELALAWRVHFGMLLAGWGVFNVVEGLIDHRLLGIHHVRDDLGAPLGWDLAFLAFGVVLIVAGAALARTGKGLARRQRSHRSSHSAR
jgi:uncharacterized membrane protein